ncbi:DNA-processing protein DprA [Dyadobacter psychrotolerans]|uniref:DNA-processing protein DprA n=1 Tax=Dyadobacter psychrotolerans TaxID=2541721 RepID=A0A4R5DYB9_9BACT|nr:DNA-processing protein DprA [Dyadobacter psychrotolerans]TDE17191.1 DNA-processing protein DprA [Dyadobacter psychrotolerans]
MEINKAIILKVICLPSISRKTSFALLNMIADQIVTEAELVEFIEQSDLLSNTLNKSDFETAFCRAEEVYEKSMTAGIKLISYFDGQYPKLLRTTDDPPLMLSAKGNYDDINFKKPVAIIGTRKPGEQGREIAFALGESFGKSGFNVVSGLAPGCDTAAHLGCLNESGYTVAVLAFGIDQIAVQENRLLAEKILDQSGLLLSEYLFGQKAKPRYFVERDRIQAGLSEAVIVVETGIKGGTMHTVKYARNYNRILAASDHVRQDNSTGKTQGNQHLIQNSLAVALTDSKDIDLLKSKISASPF